MANVFDAKQVAAFVGFGGSIKGDMVSLSPNKSDKPDDWSHD